MLLSSGCRLWDEDADDDEDDADEDEDDADEDEDDRELLSTRFLGAAKPVEAEDPAYLSSRSVYGSAWLLDDLLCDE